MKKEPCDEKDLDLEQLVLKESLVSTIGLNANSLQIGLKGDPSIRETSLVRSKYQSPVDPVISGMQQGLEELLLRRGTYRIFVGFNSGEIRTNSVFDPLGVEIHDGVKLADPDYINRHFPPLDFSEKVALIRHFHDYMLQLEVFDRLPSHWRRILLKRHDAWEPMEQDEIRAIVGSFKILRNLPDLYLRNATICIVQDMVRLQFNCDGTQIVSAENYQQFLHENF